MRRDLEWAHGHSGMCRENELDIKSNGELTEKRVQGGLGPKRVNKAQRVRSVGSSGDCGES